MRMMEPRPYSVLVFISEKIVLSVVLIKWTDICLYFLHFCADHDKGANDDFTCAVSYVSTFFRVGEGGSSADALRA